MTEKLVFKPSKPINVAPASSLASSAAVQQNDAEHGKSTAPVSSVESGSKRKRDEPDTIEIIAQETATDFAKQAELEGHKSTESSPANVESASMAPGTENGSALTSASQPQTLSKIPKKVFGSGLQFGGNSLPNSTSGVGGSFGAFASTGSASSSASGPSIFDAPSSKSADSHSGRTDDNPALSIVDQQQSQPVDVTTGEEDDIILFKSTRCQLKVYDTQSKEWKHKGFGSFHLNVTPLSKKDISSTTAACRIIMRNIGTMALILNLSLFDEMNIRKSGERSLIFGAIETSTDSTLNIVNYAVQFDTAQSSQECYELAIKYRSRTVCSKFYRDEFNRHPSTRHGNSTPFPGSVGEVSHAPVELSPSITDYQEDQQDEEQDEYDEGAEDYEDLNSDVDEEA